MLRYVHLVHQQDEQTDSIDRMNRSSMTDAMEQMAFDVRCIDDVFSQKERVMMIDRRCVRRI